MKKPGIVLRVDLTNTDWKPEAGGKGRWSCAALRMPGARFLGLVGREGRRVDELWYERRGRAIVWKGGSNPPGLQVELGFSSPITARFQTLFWIGLAFMGGLMFASGRVDTARLLSIIGG